MILSDLHFGKTGHFRKAGIAVPQSVYKEDLQRLVSLIQHFKPKQVIAVGDLFHSHANLELELFKRWRLDFEHLPFHLVLGNHDILHERIYQDMQLTLWQDAMQLGSVRFVHEERTQPDGVFTFSGHLHPGILLQGLGKQSLRLPCFYFSPTTCILPAFSKFTGLALVQPGACDKVFAIAENSVLSI